MRCCHPPSYYAWPAPPFLSRLIIFPSSITSTARLITTLPLPTSPWKKTNETGSTSPVAEDGDLFGGGRAVFNGARQSEAYGGSLHTCPLFALRCAGGRGALVAADDGTDERFMCVCAHVSPLLIAEEIRSQVLSKHTCLFVSDHHKNRRWDERRGGRGGVLLPNHSGSTMDSLQELAKGRRGNFFFLPVATQNTAAKNPHKVQKAFFTIERNTNRNACKKDKESPIEFIPTVLVAMT